MNDYEDVPREKREPLSAVGAMVQIRCPECKRGIVYRRGMEMNHLCPSCGIKFEREPGYFSGAIWIAVLLATPVMLTIMFLLFYLFDDIHPAVPGVLAALAFIPLVPITIKISRSIWMYLDHQMHPQRRSGGPPGDPDGSRPTPVPERPLYGEPLPVNSGGDSENGVPEIAGAGMTQPSVGPGRFIPSVATGDERSSESRTGEGIQHDDIFQVENIND